MGESMLTLFCSMLSPLKLRKTKTFNCPTNGWQIKTKTTYKSWKPATL